jgi:ABC-type sugar transport system substrate-binding protein
MAATLSASSFTLSIPRAMADAPAIYVTEYELNNSTVQQCVNDAEDVMKQEGFQDINVTKQDVFGATENTSVELYCVRDGKTLIMIVAGQDEQEVENLQSALAQRLSQ